MIWNERSPVICTLNRLVEDGSVKGDLYWPDEPGSTQKFGDISVSLISICPLKHLNIVVRRLKLVRGDEQREVFQLHYQGWPDFGVPSSSLAIRELVHLVDWFRKRGACSDQTSIDGPPVVHCSAGIGRSGSFLGLYFAMKSQQFQNTAYNPEFRKYVENQISQNMEDHLNLEISKISEKFNIKDIVGSLRKQRNPGMVQNVKQYEFIYISLQDELRCPSRPSAAVREVFSWQLRKLDVPKITMSGFIFGNNHHFDSSPKTNISGHKRKFEITNLLHRKCKKRLAQSQPVKRTLRI